MNAAFAAILTQRDQDVTPLPVPPPTEAAAAAERQAAEERAQQRQDHIREAANFEASLIPRA